MSGNEPFPQKQQDHSHRCPRRFFFWLVFLVSIALPLAQAEAAKDSNSDPEKNLAAAQISSEEPSEPAAAEDKIKTVDPLSVTVVGSRLPGFRKKVSEVASNITYKSINTTYKDENDLDLIHPLTFQDAVRDAEGTLFYDQVGNGLDTTFGLRGFPDSSAVIFLVDGVRMNEVDGDSVVYPLLIMQDMEAIQIERGSASPVYGSGAFGGVVNLTSRRPSPKRLAFFGGFELSSFKGIRFNQGVSGTLHDRATPLKGNLTYYFNGGRNVSEGKGFRDNGESRMTFFDIKTGYDFPDDEGGIHVGVKHEEDAISNPGEMTRRQFEENPRRTNKPLDGRDYDLTIVQIDASKKFWDDRILASILASWHPERNHFFVTSGTFTDFPDGFDPDTDRVTTKSKETDLTWQVSYQDAWKEIHHETMFGMEFRDAQTHALEQDFFLGNIVPSTAAETDRRASPDNLAIFWRETLKFFDKVIPYFGMRHDFSRLKTKDYLTPTQDINRRWNDSTLSAGLTVKPVQAVDLFANYSQGFRVPAVSEIAPFSGTISTNLAPEKSDSYEAGTRLRFKDLAQTKLSYFLIDLKDEIVFDSTSISAAAPFGQNINIGRSRRYGIELRQDLRPVEELEMYGSYTWTRAYVSETDAGGSLVDGRTLGLVPENRFTVGGQLRPLARFGEFYEGLRLGLNGVFTGRQHPQSFESAAQATLNATGGAGHFIKAYSVWDFILAYEWKDKEIYFRVNNLFNEKYYSRAVSATSFGTAVYPAGTFTFVNPGAPREIVLGSKWEF